MAIREILQYPDSRLNIVSTRVEHIDDSIINLLEDMRDTMQHHTGLGLAAPQLGVHKRIVVIATGDELKEIREFINPTIIASEGIQMVTDGCLSVFTDPMPMEEQIELKVQRATVVTIEATDRYGTQFTETFNFIGESGLPTPKTFIAVAIQHEIDHLDGIVFVDKLDPASRERVKEVISNNLK